VANDPARPDVQGLRDIRLRNYLPAPALRVAGHTVRRARFEAVDVHNHLGRWLTGAWSIPDVGALVALMDGCNVGSIVNLDGMWGEELAANLQRYDHAHPGRFATFCQVDWSEASSGDFGERLAGALRRSVDAGARGLKVWKSLGLHVRDGGGDLLLPDDPRLVPVWAAAADAAVPVMIHVADPIAFFDPLDERNERLEELLAHPDWWFGDRARFPSFERLRESFEALVAANQATTFVGAHVASSAEDLAWVDRMLATYPNLSIDVAARIAELGRQPRAAARLVAAHPGRVLFGTDAFPPDAETYAIHFRCLETEDEYFAYGTDEPPAQGRWSISGLGLSDDLLRGVYGENARQLIPGLV
jgi:predicted TIM-barrel fold metal-dependent hydrolase